MLNKRLLNVYYQLRSPTLLIILFSICLYQKPLSAQTVNTVQFHQLDTDTQLHLNRVGELEELEEEFPHGDTQPQTETAQTQPPSDIFRRPGQDNPPIAPEKPTVLPPPEKLLPSPPSTSPTPEQVPNNFTGTITVSRFEVVGNSVFSRKQLADATKDFTNKPITFAQLLQASEAITRLYHDKGYDTSGAFIPANQTFKQTGSVITIKVVEGSLESIQVRGLKRLNPNYVRTRLAIATHKPLNVNRLLQALQVLQLNPLIKNISAELAAGSTPGTSILDVKVAETQTSSIQISLDNDRIPSIGSFERQIQFNQANLLGLGDGLSIAYANTDGSNDVNVNYTLPINPHNGTIGFTYNYTDSEIIEKPFDILGIKGTSQDFSLTVRQPVVQTPTEEFALGLAATRRVSDVGFLEALVGGRQPFPEPGSDKNGNTRLAILRFFQDWTKRSNKQVLAARSQFSFGINAFDATINPKSPDGEFFSWQGQAQLVRLVAPDTLFLIRADAQIADRTLVPLEQFGLGGQRTVRGYRQDLLLSDNALTASVEFRYPILRIPKLGGSVLQVTPFFDFGTAGNNSGGTKLETNNLASVGLGLLWQSNRISARFDWGYPLIDVNSRGNTLQEDGLYFSIVYTQPF